jgi:hypothetical protein
MYLGMDAPLSPAPIQMRVFETIFSHFGFGFVAFAATKFL